LVLTYILLHNIDFRKYISIINIQTFIDIHLTDSVISVIEAAKQLKHSKLEVRFGKSTTNGFKLRVSVCSIIAAFYGGFRRITTLVA
jgi:hypothetical protein